MSTKSVILVDFDNVFYGLWELDAQTAIRFASDPMVWFPLLAQRHLVDGARRWLVARCYLNPAGYVACGTEPNGRLYLSRFRPGWVRAGFEVIDCPSMTRTGKNAADIRMVIDALDLLNSKCVYDEFVIASGDADFAPLLQRIRAEDRRSTVISPGYIASAFASLADQVLDFDAIDSLVTQERASSPPTVLESKRADNSPEAGFGDFVRNKYEEAVGPLNLASLAHQAANAFPAAKETGWYGAGSFTAAISRLNLPQARFSQYYLWDAERHQQPVDSKLVSDLPQPVASLVRNLDLPRLGKEAWPAVFTVLARYAAERDFNLTESTRWSRDELAKQGIQIPRSALAYVVRAVQLGGAALNVQPPPEPTAIARAFVSSLLERAELNGIHINDEEENELLDWFGLRPDHLKAANN